MKNHSLKEGMTLVKPTKEQVKVILELAKEREIELGNCEISTMQPNLYFAWTRRMSSVISHLHGYNTVVTFEQFITAMVTPETVETVNCNGNVHDQINPAVESIVQSQREEIEALKKRLSELEPKVDMRVDFGKNVTFSTLTPTACVGNLFAKDGDRFKVLVSGLCHEWQLLPDYHEGRNAVQLIKTTK
jgi:hypothetical protein